MRLVLDTDVLVAGLRSRTGAARLLLNGIEEGAIQPLITVAILLEYEAVLTRPEQLVAMAATYHDVQDVLDKYLVRSEEVWPYYDYAGMIRDPNDDKFVTAAINGMADAIVTFNTRDYVPRDTSAIGLGVEVCRPGDILWRLSWRPSATSRSGFLPH
jgi:putative PIN family toxin of toxin-antitoxin system